jgi:hypothetical protein
MVLPISMKPTRTEVIFAQFCQEFPCDATTLMSDLGLETKLNTVIAIY